MLTFRMTAGFKGSQADIASRCAKGSGDALEGATIFADGMHERTKGYLTYSAYIYDTITRQLYVLAVMDWLKRFPENHFILQDFWRNFIYHVRQHFHLMQENNEAGSSNFDDIPSIALKNFSMDEAG